MLNPISGSTRPNDLQAEPPGSPKHPASPQDTAVPNRAKRSASAEFDAMPGRGKRVAPAPANASDISMSRPEGERRSLLIQKFKNTLPLPPRPAFAPVLQYDRSPGTKENFRSSDDFDLPDGLNQTGWKDLHVSGSASIASLDQISRLHPSTDNPVIVLDVREESHAIVGGYPGTWRAPNNWANVGKSREEVLADEQDRIHALKAQDTVQILHRKDVKNDVANPRAVTLTKPQIFSEEELVKKAGASYVRLTVTDHLGPRREDVDAFVEMERGMAAHEKLHVHCGVGQGRTGIFIAMHDMLHNAVTVSFDDIVQRQLAFNPGRALDFHKDVTHEGRSDFRHDRLEFISLFYAYAKMNPKGTPQRWSEWLDSYGNKDLDTK
ncbi:type III secretion system effector XopH [Ralstonia solanacearum]|nr:type III secretion system effector XopH [Ralstonia solanacearum]